MLHKSAACSTGGLAPAGARAQAGWHPFRFHRQVSDILSYSDPRRDQASLSTSTTFEASTSLPVPEAHRHLTIHIRASNIQKQLSKWQAKGWLYPAADGNISSQISC